VTSDELRRRIAKTLGRIANGEQLGAVQRGLEAGAEVDAYVAAIAEMFSRANAAELDRLREALRDIAAHIGDYPDDETPE